MNRIHIPMTALAALLALAGCAKEEENTFDSIDSSAIELSSVSTDPMTKAVITGTEFTTTEAAAGIGLFLLDAEGKAYGSNEPNVKYYHSGSKWVADKPLRAGGTSGMLYGYYPYSEGVTDIAAIPVASSIDGTDYLYAAPVEVNSSNAKSVSLSLSHALARVSLSFKRDKSYEGSGALSSISLSGDCVAASGTLNAKTGSINAAAGAFSADGLDRTVDDETPTIVECLVVPVPIESGTPELKIACTIDGKAYATTFTGDLAALIQGRQTTIELTVKNTSLSIDGSSIGALGDGGTQTVTVGGDYKVTISLDSGVPAHDVLTDVYVDGNNVIIKASSFQGKGLVCNVGDKAQCERVVTNDKFTFTISEIRSNIEAVLGYAPPVTLTVTSDSNGKVWIGDDESKTSGPYEFGEQVVIHAAPNNNFRFFKWDDNNKELDRTITVGVTDVTYSAKFISSDMIPGLFTVDANKKQVFFSKGNLYCSGVEFNDDGTVKSMANAQWGFEANQYDTTPSRSDNRVENHISHFMWCDDAANAMALKYDSTWDGETPFFAAKNFTVNGFSSWGTLTGGAGGEWEYLLDKRNTAYDSNRRYAAVKVSGMAGLLIFPDDFSSWPSGAGVEPQNFNTYSENWNGKDYTVAEFNALQNKGCVFLPAAGSRNGEPSLREPARVGGVGFDGFYWSASPGGDSGAYDLDFYHFLVLSNKLDARSLAYAVRLVTECQSEPSAE